MTNQPPTNNAREFVDGEWAAYIHVKTTIATGSHVDYLYGIVGKDNFNVDKPWKIPTGILIIFLTNYMLLLILNF